MRPTPHASGPLLLLDSYLDEAGAPEVFLPDDDTPTLRLRAAHLDPGGLPRDPRPFRGILITGSSARLHDQAPWMRAVEELVRAAARARVPVLGVCFGHQLIARALYGPDAVRTMPEPEFGWRDVVPTRPGGFLARAQAAAGLPPGPFHCFVSHADEVVVGAPGTADLLVQARSEASEIQAYRVRGLPIQGLQFHCELPLAEARELFLERTSQDPDSWTLVRRGRMLQRAIDRTPLWRTLLGTFLESCDGRTSRTATAA